MQKTFKYKSILFIIVLIGFFTVTDFNSGMESKYVFQDVKQEDMNINIVFVGFDEYYTFEENYEFLLSSNINTFYNMNYYNPTNNYPHSDYNINYTFSSLNTADEDALSAYIDSIAVSTPYLEYRINTSAVDEYIVTQEYEDIADFLILTEGSLIDAEQVENYIGENLYSESEEESGYTLYMMNFSRLDNEALNQDHTYGYSFADADAIALDPDHVTGEYVRTTIGWGGDQRFCFVDISALTYNMFYYALMFEINMVLAPAYTFYDLDSYTRTLDLNSPTGQFDLHLYIS
ncbi:MAG: hypothetical protein ACXAAM_05920, partial [Candidatus Heimdallarchaeaceae archaeon]